MLNVFLSYRREDSAGYTGRLNDRFVERWGEARVFFDLDTIAPGEDFVEAIDRTLAQCEVMILVIGPRWLTATEPDGRRRIDEPADYHRIEVERALQRGIRIIPALVGGARMPGEAQLPEALKKLARRNAVEISDKRFRYDADQLSDEVDRILEKAQAAAQAQARDDAARLEEARRAEAQEKARRAADEQRRQDEAAQRIPEEHRRTAEARGLAVLDVLVLIPAPSDAAPFDPDRAWQDLSQAAQPLVARGALKLERLPASSENGLRRRLAQAPCTVLHFVGCGSSRSAAQYGTFTFEDSAGRSRGVNANHLAALLKQHEALQLVVLQARQEGDDPLGTLADTLVANGVPAVVSTPRFDGDALAAFFQAFYGALLGELPGEQAIQCTRDALVHRGKPVPALRLRARNTGWRLTAERSASGRV